MVVTFGVLFAALLVLGAVVWDSGRGYDERHQLQDGADAVVLALAFDCARDATSCLIGANGRAQALADANSKDGESALDPTSPLAANPLIDLAAKRVTADLRSQEPGQTPDSGALSLSTRWPDGTEDVPVRARAIAEWGSVISDTTLALTFSECEFDRGTANGTVFDDPSMEITLLLHDGAPEDPCATNPAHANAPGQFGWLDNENCYAEIAADATVGGEVGNNVSRDCRALFHRAQQELLNTDQLIPIFDSVSGQGQNAQYHLIGIAAFRITGWYFAGQYYAPTRPTAPCSGDERCLRGYFVRFTSITGVPDPDAPDLGVNTARLIG